MSEMYVTRLDISVVASITVWYQEKNSLEHTRSPTLLVHMRNAF